MTAGSVKKALIVDDEPDIRELLEITLGRMNVETMAAEQLSTAFDLLANNHFDLCLTDMHLPDGNGIDLVRKIGTDYPEMPVAMITAFGSMDTAVDALKAGAFDFVQKPVDLDQLRALVETALRVAGDASDADVDAATKLTGSSPVMQSLRATIKKLARSQAPIYVSGESGTGKEVAARLIHEQGPRSSGPFVPVNCGAIPSELMESEFFGHLKGSFTGAGADKQGLFQAANGGTLFLDEVADLPLTMQVKLLRAIQEKAVRAVGSSSEEKIDVRILSATHKDLAGEVSGQRFRQDLYYRLNVIELAMPPLRNREGDVAELADQILDRIAADYAVERPSLNPQAQAALNAYEFPGNVRELENILERAVTLCDGNSITPEDLSLGGGSVIGEPAEQPDASTVHADQPDELGASIENSTTNETEATDSAVTSGTAASESRDSVTPTLKPGESLESYLENIERKLITEALERTRWNKTAAAKELGITFRALRYRLKKLELE
ncbi:MAG: sigma-54 dependent transcriptional regulator [Pseudomonadaceae bacterium]|nr:sigma-54 dependent transcriptional regulator [Pseudomonadaceae bacterium]